MKSDIKQQMITEMQARRHRQSQSAPVDGGLGGYGGYVGWGQGPREIRRADIETEAKLPKAQADMAIAELATNCIGLTLAILAILGALWLLLYRYGYGSFILFPIFSIYVFFGRWVAIRSTKQSDGIDGVINASSAFLLVCFFLLSALHCIGEIVLPWELIVLAVAVWVVGCWRYCTVEPRGRLVQRLNIEITDPGHPPMRLPVDRLEPLDIYLGLDEPKQPRPEPRPLPPAPARAEWVEKASNGTGKIHQLELPISPDKMRALAEHIIIKEQPFSETACCRTSGILSQPEYGSIRDWLIASERGFARWADENNHRAGAEITAKGRALLRAFMPEVNPKIVSRQLPPPPPDNVDSS